MKPLSVRIIAPFLDISEIASNARDLAIALSEIGVNVAISEVPNVSPFKAIVEDITLKQLQVMAQTQITGPYVSIFMLPPETMKFNDPNAKANIVWTAYDTNKLPFLASLILNSNSINEIWTPTKACYDSFSAAGVNKNKLKHISWGVDTDRFKPGNPKINSLKENGNFYFGYIGSFNGNSGYDYVLRAFYDEFNDDSNVKLLLKAFIGNVAADKETEFVSGILNRFKGNSKAEVIYIPKNIPTDEMRALSHTPDCFVCTPRSKAWGANIIKSMAAGVPVIANVNAGNRAYTNHGNSILVSSSLKLITDIEWLTQNPLQQEHSWCDVNVDELKKAMRGVYDKTIDVEPIKMAARRDVLKLDWKKVAMEVLKNIKIYGE